MFTPNSSNQISISPKAISIQEPSASMQVDQKDSVVSGRNDMQHGGVSQPDFFVLNSKKLQDDLKMLGLKIKQHEDHLKYLRTQKHNMDGSILDMQAVLGKYQSASTPKKEPGVDEITEQLRQHEKSAARVLWQMKTRNVTQASSISWTKDVLGIVASLGKVDDDNLSRLFSEYLGVQKMLAIVCKTSEDVKALEIYNEEGSINKDMGLHGLGSSIAAQLDGRFLVICLEASIPYFGDFIANDPEKRLDLLKPRLPNGEYPPGFLGFAVNMIHVENAHMFGLTSSGCGLRETLFYHLFGRLQVYKTRADMLQALPCISDGALSLDGGMMKSTGEYLLGYREEVDVRFPISAAPTLPLSYYETETDMTETKWKKERLQEDIRREQALLDQSKYSFNLKKQQFVRFLAESSSFLAQQQNMTGQNVNLPR